MRNCSARGVWVFVASVFLSMLLVACVVVPVPHDDWRTGQHRGAVRDGATGLPISGARVTLESARSPAHTASALSLSDGTFEVGPVVEREVFYLVWLGPAEGECADFLTVSHPGYESVKINWRVFTSATGGLCRNERGHHDVRMMKKR
jgi:hypothetical protein